MSKLLEDMRNEAAREAARKAAILTAIEIWREEGFTELEIEKKAITKFGITAGEANEYMSKKSA